MGGARVSRAGRVRYGSGDWPASGPSGRVRGSAGTSVASRPRRWSSSSSCSVRRGQLILGPVKTRAGNRELPLIGLAKNALAARRQAQDTDRANLGR